MFNRFTPDDLHHVRQNKAAGHAYADVLTNDDFSQAIKEISLWDGYQPTPLYQLHDLAKEIGVKQISYKDEGPRFGLGSFKALGGAYAALRVLAREVSKIVGRDVLLSDIRNGVYDKEVSNITLTSATDGNHGRSLAWGCQRFGAPCRIYIHAEVSQGRADAMTAYGADVVRIDGDYDDSVRIAREEAEANNWFIVSDTSWQGYTQPPTDVMAGYGLMTSEICNAMEEPPTHVFLQGGVGGLAASVAAFLRQYWQERSPRVVIVEPELAACLFKSAKAGTATVFNIETETLMAGLSCGDPSPLGWAILREEADDFITIPEKIVAPSMQILAAPLSNDPKIEGGESAVAGLAALIMACQSNEHRQRLGLDENSHCLIIGSEGITDPELYYQLIEEKIDA